MKKLFANKTLVSYILTALLIPAFTCPAADINDVNHGKDVGIFHEIQVVTETKTTGDVNDANAFPSQAGRDAPRLLIRNWITPNPPERDAFEEKIVVIEFWATWCPHCIEVIPRMIKLTKEYSEKGALFIALSQDKSAAPVRKMIQEKNINYHVAMDTGLGDKLKVLGVPQAFVIDNNKKIIWNGHPKSEAFETAIEQALEKIPPPLLEGINLGPFDELRTQLEGGRGFPEAYKKLKNEAERGERAERADRPDRPDRTMPGRTRRTTEGGQPHHTQSIQTGPESSKAASEILQAIEERLTERIEKIHALRETDPVAAYDSYREIIRKFRGAQAVREAMTDYRELKEDPEVQAAESLEKAQKSLQRCRKCRDCDNFNLTCKNCVELNKPAIERAKETLTDVRDNYSDTKAAEKSRELLEKIEGEAQPVNKVEKEDANDLPGPQG